MITAKKMFDLGFLEQMNDKNLIVQVITLYIHDAHLDLQVMMQAFQSGNYDGVYKAAHKLKSSTGLLRARSLYNILVQTEKTAKEGSEINLLAGLVNAARCEFKELRYELEEKLEQV